MSKEDSDHTLASEVSLAQHKGSPVLEAHQQSDAPASPSTPRRALGRVTLRQAIIVALLALSLASAALLHQRDVNYRAAFRYDVRADYRFEYDRERGERVALALHGDGLHWPKLEGAWDSAFLELQVKSGPLGRLIDPSIELELEGRVLRQYFERGGQGRRLFDVTPWLKAAPPGNAKIAVRTSHASWSPRGAALHVLRGARPSGPLLVLAPHPDDAEIAAFGLYSQRPAWVVTVTAGDAGNNIYRDIIADRAAAYTEKAHIRVWDSLAIPQMGGVPAQQVANLGYFDGLLETMHREPERPVEGSYTRIRDISALRRNPLDKGCLPREATWRNLVNDMAQLLANVRPSAIVAPHPQLDAHPDHRFTTIALLEALARTDAGDGRLLLYTNHCPGSELYPFGPRDGTVPIPPMVEGGVYFQTVWSQPLDARRQSRKGMAIQAQHDLRHDLLTTPPTLLGLLRDGVIDPLEHLISVDESYDRRAVRPNELFLVVDFAKAGTLLESFHATYRR